jgi:hypothetical protein
MSEWLKERPATSTGAGAYDSFQLDLRLVIPAKAGIQGWFGHPPSRV